jgi:hypothetical protein
MNKILLILFMVCSCSIKSNKTDISTKDTLVKAIMPTRHFQIDPSKTFGQYAINCKLVSTDSGVKLFFPQLNDTLKFAIDSLRQIDSINLKIWTALILIKEYSHHLECCNQSFETRIFNYRANDFTKDIPLDKEKNYVLYTFLELTRQLDIASSKTEFLSSGFIHSYLSEHADLAQNKLIKPYFDKVDKIEKKAELELKRREAKEKTATNRRFGNMAGRRIYAKLFVRYSASVPADGIQMSSKINNELL